VVARLAVPVLTLTFLAGFTAPPAGATHAYRCDLGEDPRLRQTACLAHHVWDSVTSGRPDQAGCAVQRALGFVNVRECEA